MRSLSAAVPADEADRAAGVLGRRLHGRLVPERHDGRLQLKRVRCTIGACLGGIGREIALVEESEEPLDIHVPVEHDLRVDQVVVAAVGVEEAPRRKASGWRRACRPTRSGMPCRGTAPPKARRRESTRGRRARLSSRYTPRRCSAALVRALLAGEFAHASLPARRLRACGRWRGAARRRGRRP